MILQDTNIIIKYNKSYIKLKLFIYMFYSVYAVIIYFNSYWLLIYLHKYYKIEILLKKILCSD